MAQHERWLEKNQRVWISAPANYTGAAATNEYINLAKGNRIVFHIQSGAWAGGNAAVTLWEATTAAGGAAQQVAFTKMFTNIADVTSMLLVETVVAGNTFNVGTANSLYEIEVPADQLDRPDGYDFINLRIASPGANNDFYSVSATVSELRHAAAPGVQEDSVV